VSVLPSPEARDEANQRIFVAAFNHGAHDVAAAAVEQTTSPTMRNAMRRQYLAAMTTLSAR
jgi:hypothetical protein